MTAIYTCISPDIQTPEQVVAYRETLHIAMRTALRSGIRHQSAYTRIPNLTMKDLPGTTWRNLWTTGIEIVKVIGPDRFGKMGPDPLHSSMFTIGCWRDDQFQISDWIRIDNLPADVQIMWAIERVRYCKNELRILQKRAGQISKPAFQMKTRYENNNLQQALQELRQITQRHYLPPIDLVAIALPGEQLALFI